MCIYTFGAKLKDCTIRTQAPYHNYRTYIHVDKNINYLINIIIYTLYVVICYMYTCTPACTAEAPSSPFYLNLFVTRNSIS